MNGVFVPVNGGPKRFKPGPAHAVCVRSSFTSNATCKLVVSEMAMLRLAADIGERRNG
jgi:hypothetical protein